MLQIEGVVVELQLGQGKVNAKGCEDDLNADGTAGKLGKCIGGELPVDLGIPGLSLKTGDGGAVKGSVGWNLDLNIGMSRSRGFYVNTNKVPNQPEFRVGASLGLTEVTGPELKAQLAIIDVDAETNSSKPEFVGQFGIDIKDDPNDGATDFDLTVAEMKRLRIKDVIVVTVRAQVDINWHLAASASAALPGISTDFRLTWAWGLTSGPPPPPTNKDDLKIAFNKVTLNTGKFFGQALNPYLQAGHGRHQAAPADHRHDLHARAGHLRPVQGGRRVRDHDRDAGGEVQHPSRRRQDPAVPQGDQAGQAAPRGEVRR